MVWGGLFVCFHYIREFCWLGWVMDPAACSSSDIPQLNSSGHFLYDLHAKLPVSLLLCRDVWLQNTLLLYIYIYIYIHIHIYIYISLWEIKILISNFADLSLNNRLLSSQNRLLHMYFTKKYLPRIYFVQAVEWLSVNYKVVWTKCMH